MELEQEIKPDKRKRIMSDTQKRKMSDARDAYWARVKELKKLAPEVERLGGEIEGLGDGKDIKKFEPTLAREHVLRKIFLKTHYNGSSYKPITAGSKRQVGTKRYSVQTILGHCR